MYLYGKGAGRRLPQTPAADARGDAYGLTIYPHHQVRPKGVSTVFLAGVSKNFSWEGASICQTPKNVSWEGASIRQTPNAIPNVERTKSTQTNTKPKPIKIIPTLQHKFSK